MKRNIYNYGKLSRKIFTQREKNIFRDVESTGNSICNNKSRHKETCFKTTIWKAIKDRSYVEYTKDQKRPSLKPSITLTDSHGPLITFIVHMSGKAFSFNMKI